MKDAHAALIAVNTRGDDDIYLIDFLHSVSEEVIDSGFQGESSCLLFSDTSKSEGWRGLYGLSLYGRSKRKKGFIR
jgi:hypothetical protein